MFSKQQKNALNKYSPTRDTGNIYEQKALDYLLAHQLELVEKQFSSKLGELDLVMLDNDELVFVEVRYRTSSQYGSAEASVDHRKQKKLIKTAELFLKQRRWQNQYPCRFDVIAFDQNGIQWIKHAFEVQV
nr:YraN family protein [Pleionea sp. CnH1-48]